ncbi:MAG: AMP-binding protein [Chitinophagales bacterium]|nr:AMP-binding protein [Hyphomicrobiales bacterium]
MSGQTILSMFAAQAERTPERAALITVNRALTYAALSANVKTHALALPVNRQPVLIMTDDKADFIASFFAAMFARRPAFPLPQTPHAARPARFHIGAQPDEFYWGATSGSTGEPKIFARTHASWIASFAAHEAVFPFGEAETVMIPGALTHSLFLYGAVHALARGDTVLAPRRFSPKSVIKAMRDYRATVLYAVPSMLEELLAAGATGLNLKYVFCGGAKLGTGLRRRFESAAPGADIIEFYGASELSFVSYVSTSHPAPDGSVGRLFPDIVADVRLENGQQASAGDKGLIHISSPMLFSGYLGEPPVVAGEFVTAGDLGFVDAEGFLYLTSRADREINSKGHKITPETVEMVLAQHPHIVGAAVVGIADEKRGAIVAAAIEVAKGARLSRAELSAHCRALLPLADCPQLYFQAARLPMTRTGKIAFSQIHADLEGGAAGYEALT